jgi:hypothetical protein
MRIYINERPVDAAEGSDTLSAVRGFDAELASKIEKGGAYITDGRAIRLAGTEPVTPGAILRVVVMARRTADTTDADA